MLFWTILRDHAIILQKVFLFSQVRQHLRPKMGDHYYMYLKYLQIRNFKNLLKLDLNLVRAQTQSLGKMMLEKVTQ